MIKETAKEPVLKTKHNLSFEAAFYFDGTVKFRVGTVTGVYDCIGNSYNIIALANNDPGNGHLDDVFEWFEHSCRRDRKKLRVVEIWNNKFKQHLISKRGFSAAADGNVEKILYAQ